MQFLIMASIRNVKNLFPYEVDKPILMGYDNIYLPDFG